MKTEFEAELEYELGELPIGESEWDEEPPWAQLPTWPTGRTFDPGPLTPVPIATSTYPASPREACQALAAAFTDVRDTLRQLNAAIMSLRRIQKVTPRDQATWDERSRKVENARGTLVALMQGTIQDLRGNFYTGCPKALFARVARLVTRLQLQGGWQQSGKVIEILRNLRKTLILELTKKSK
jgi:hypothetical protein